MFESPNTQLILGYPWLKKHNPNINWELRQVEGWSDKCLKHSLRSAISTHLKHKHPKEEVDITIIPPVYHDLAPIFSKQRALSLPPHHLNDCSIDLLPGSSLPASQLYNLSGPE